MAFRFRRSVKLGKGIRLNASKRGIGMSVGKMGFRRSIHSTGRSTSTIGIPGTGLSYVNTKTSPSRRKTRKEVGPSRTKSSTKDNAATVDEYNNYIDGITHLHLHEPKVNDWREISNVQAPYERDAIGPLEAEAMKQYNAYEPNMFEKLIKPFRNKKLKQLTQHIQSAHEQDTKNYQQWEQRNHLAKKCSPW